MCIADKRALGNLSIFRAVFMHSSDLSNGKNTMRLVAFCFMNPHRYSGLLGGVFNRTYDARKAFVYINDMIHATKHPVEMILQSRSNSCL